MSRGENWEGSEPKPRISGVLYSTDLERRRNSLFTNQLRGKFDLQQSHFRQGGSCEEPLRKLLLAMCSGKKAVLFGCRAEPVEKPQSRFMLELIDILTKLRRKQYPGTEARRWHGVRQPHIQAPELALPPVLQHPVLYGITVSNANRRRLGDWRHCLRRVMLRSHELLGPVILPVTAHSVHTVLLAMSQPTSLGTRYKTTLS